MPELVLHIGLPKTATSFLQQWLRNNRDPLAGHGVWAPPRTILPHRLAVEAITNERLIDRGDVMFIRKVPYEEEAVAELSKGLADGRLRILAVSSEYFYEADPQLVRQQLSDRFGVPTRIVVALRRQDRWLESCYNQSVKVMGAKHPFNAPGYAAHLDWFKLIDRWSGVFGNDRIQVLNFDRAKQHQNVLQLFLHHLDPALDDIDLTAFAAVSTGNESLPADLLEFKRLANALGEFGLQNLLSRMAAEGYRGPPFRMPADKARELIAVYKESNDRVARDILHIEGPLFPDYDVEEGRDGVDLHGKLPLETLARVVAFHCKETSREIDGLKAELKVLKRRLARADKLDQP